MRRSNSVTQLAYLLLAADSRSLELLGASECILTKRATPMSDLPPGIFPRDTDPGSKLQTAPFDAGGPRSPQRLLTRREWLVGIGGLFAATSAAKWLWTDSEHFRRAEVVVTRAESYQVDLIDIVRRGLAELGVGKEKIRGKSVLLKPNLVEPTAPRAYNANTRSIIHSRFAHCRSLSAAGPFSEVFVAEGQGHCRDTSFVLEQSGLDQVLDDDKITFRRLEL